MSLEETKCPLAHMPSLLHSSMDTNLNKASTDSILPSSLGSDEVERAYYHHSFDYKIHNVNWNLSEGGPKTEIPFVKLREYTDLNLIENEHFGMLTDRIIEVCSSDLQPCAEPGKYALAKCDLSQKHLCNIDILSFHKYLRTLNLSRNKLTSLEPLSHLPFLEYLDASYNQLTECLDFRPPLNLTYANLRNNSIEVIPDLSNFWSLVYLNLSYNYIDKITGLETLKYLNYLDLSANKIEIAENIFTLNVQTLYLDYNKIRDINATKISMSSLLNVSFSNNQLSSLEKISHLHVVEYVDMSNNNIVDLSELYCLHRLSHLDTLDLRGNSITTNSKYRQYCMSLLRNISILDGVPVECEQKGEAMYLYSLSFEQIARCNSVTAQFATQMVEPKINASTIPCNENMNSITILVGPVGCGKRALIKEVYAKYPRHITIGVSHTTRRKYSHEVHGKDYYFITEQEFGKMLLEGRFLSYSLKYGSSYAFSYDELNKATGDHSILLCHSDVISAIQVRNKYPNTKLILAVPKTSKVHAQELLQKYQCTPWFMDSVRGHIVSNRKTKVPSQESTQIVQDISERWEFLGNENITEQASSEDLEEQSIEKLTPPTSVTDQNESSNISQIRAPILKGEKLEKSPVESHSVAFDEQNEIIEIERVASTGKDAFISSCYEAGRSAEVKFHIDDVEQKYDSAFSNTFFKNITSDASSEKSVDTKKSQHSTASLSSYLNTDGINDTNFSTENVLDKAMQEILSMDPYHCSAESETSGSDRDRKYSSELIFSDFKNFLRSHTRESVDTALDASFEFFLNVQLKRRESYLTLYRQNPGLFSNIIYTDNYSVASKQLHDILSLRMKMKSHVKVGECNKMIHKEMRDARKKKIQEMMKSWSC